MYLENASLDGMVLLNMPSRSRVGVDWINPFCLGTSGGLL
jgi:hypothetical protein